MLCSLDAQMQSSRYFSIDDKPLLVKIYTILDALWTGSIDPSHLQPQMIKQSSCQIAFTAFTLLL